MNGQTQTNAKLIEENALLKQKIRDLEQSESELKQAEEALRKREAKISSVFRAAPVGIGMVINRVIKEVNDTLCAMTGYDQEELIGMHSRILYLTDEDYEFVGREKYRQIAQKGTGTVETRLRRKDGGIINVILSSTVINPNDQSQGVTFTALDITERKRAEEALRESKEQYQFVVENLKEVVFRTDAEGHWTFLNSAWAEVTGFSVGESLGKVFLEFVYPEDRQLNLELFRPLIERKKDYCRHEIRYMNKEGGFRWIEVWARLTLDEKGNATGTAGTLTDITERKQAEEALRESEEKYRLVVENASEAIFIAQEGFLRFVNQATIQIMEYSEKEIASIPFTQFIHPEDMEMVLERHRKRLKGEEVPPVYAFRIVTRNGNVRWMEIHSVVISWKDKPATLNFLSDITDRKQAEEERRSLEERLQRAEKMEAHRHPGRRRCPRSQQCTGYYRRLCGNASDGCG